jgi:hypothetical protein
MGYMKKSTYGHNARSVLSLLYMLGWKAQGNSDMTFVISNYGDRGSTVVKVLRYKSEGCWFDPRWSQFFIDINPSDRPMALESTQPLTEMSARRISWG